MSNIGRLIEASSLGTPDAASPPCIAPDVDHYSKQTHDLTGSRTHTISVPPGVGDDCRLYFCPTSGHVECPTHGGFDVCCNRPDLHQPITT